MQKLGHFWPWEAPSGIFDADHIALLIPTVHMLVVLTEYLLVVTVHLMVPMVHLLVVTVHLLVLTLQLLVILQCIRCWCAGCICC